MLDVFLRKRAGQEQRKNFSTCYLAIHQATDAVAGFYTLSASSVKLDRLPEAVQKKLPRYNDVPVARMGRLAVDQDFTGQGLGAALVADALKRIVNSGIGCFAVVVDAKEERAVNFYRHLGFDSFQDKTDVLYLALATVKKSIPKK